MLQQVECFLHVFAQSGQISFKIVLHQHTQITGRGVEALNIFDQEERFQDSFGKFVFQLGFRIQHGALDLRLYCCPDALEHQIKGRQLPDIFLADIRGNLLENAQHGSFSNRTMFAFEGIMLRQGFDRSLE